MGPSVIAVAMAGGAALDSSRRHGKGITVNVRCGNMWRVPTNAMVLMPRRPARARIAACLFLASLSPCCADPAPVIHYAPGENLEHVDVALIDGAGHEIDMAAYVLTDWPVMQALTRAADRGVAIRIYLDGAQFAEREPAKVFNDLAERLASR